MRNHIIFKFIFVTFLTLAYPFSALAVYCEIKDITDAEQGKNLIIQHMQGMSANEAEQYLLSLCEQIVDLNQRQTDLQSQNSGLQSQNVELQDRVDLLQQEADEGKKDQLTGLPNRRRFMELLPTYTPDVQSGLKTFVVALDLDKFKRVNDEYGHHIGDEVLKGFSETAVNTIKKIVEANLRKDDFLFRLGGEEFLLMLKTHNQSEVEEVLERLRIAIAEHTYPVTLQNVETTFNVTVSMGVKEFRPEENYPYVAERADFALYKAKQTRNTIAFYGLPRSFTHKIGSSLRTYEKVPDTYITFKSIHGLTQTANYVATDPFARQKHKKLYYFEQIDVQLMVGQDVTVRGYGKATFVETDKNGDLLIQFADSREIFPSRFIEENFGKVLLPIESLKLAADKYLRPGDSVLLPTRRWSRKPKTGTVKQIFHDGTIEIEPQAGIADVLAGWVIPQRAIKTLYLTAKEIQQIDDCDTTLTQNSKKESPNG